jgi:hypothetical protein
MSNIDNMMNWGMGVGAIFSMMIQKYAYAYTIFTILLGWNILRDFVSGKGTSAFTPVKLAYLFFSVILFFSTLYLVVLVFKHETLFDNDIQGDLPFYIKTSNLLILFVFFIISLGDTLVKGLEDILPNCGDVILLLSLFLFTYLLGVMIINISIIINKKVTDG